MRTRVDISSGTPFVNQQESRKPSHVPAAETFSALAPSQRREVLARIRDNLDA